MTQSRAMSLVEAATGTFFGLILALVTNAVMMWITGVEASVTQNAIIVLGHTVVSIIRSYVVRRAFNRVRK